MYFQKNLNNKQFIAFNAVGTYIDTHNRNRYEEYLKEIPVVNYHSAVKGKKYSVIAEGIYEKQLNNQSKLTGGIRHTQSYTDNIYKGTLLYNTQMHQANTYGYAQYANQWGKLTYSIGMGVTRSWLQQEGEEDYETWSFNPRIKLSYPINKQWSVSLQGNVSTVNPSLSELSAVDQLTDSLQIQRGNPDLKPYNYYQTNVRLNYQKGKWYIGFFSNYNCRDNVIMGHVYREKNLQGQEKFIHSYANHPSFQNWRTGINVRIGMLWDILQLSGKVESNKYWSKGVNFKHTNHSIGWEIMASLMYKNLTITTGYQDNCDHLWGEEFSTGETIHLLQAQYRIKRLNVGLTMFNPFSNKDSYHRDENFLNKDCGNRHRFYVRDAAQMVSITMAWNFSFGRDYKSGSKRMNNSDNDNGVM